MRREWKPHFLWPNFPDLFAPRKSLNHFSRPPIGTSLALWPGTSMQMSPRVYVRYRYTGIHRLGPLRRGESCPLLLVTLPHSYNLFSTAFHYVFRSQPIHVSSNSILFYSDSPMLQGPRKCILSKLHRPFLPSAIHAYHTFYFEKQSLKILVVCLFESNVLICLV